MMRLSGICAMPALLATALLSWSSSSLAGELTTADYLYRLSTFTGTAALGAWPRLCIDPRTNEVYVLANEEVSIFNQRGMEIYRFTRTIEQSDARAGGPAIIDMAVMKDGRLFMIVSRYEDSAFRTALLLGNYRGEPVSSFVLENAPEELRNFLPNRVIARDGLLYLANLSEMKIVVADEAGVYRKSYEIMPLLRHTTSERKGKKVEDVELEVGDLSVDGEGNILFTVPVVGDAYRLTTDLRLERISTRGSGPGKFGIPAAIIADSEGNYLVADMLRSVVMVFDRKFTYRGAFGGRHSGPDALAVPRGLALDANNRLYVSQTENMGVSVFQLTYN